MTTIPSSVGRVVMGLAGVILTEASKLGLVFGFLGPWFFDLDAFGHLRPQFTFVAIIGATLCWRAGWSGMAVVGCLCSFVGLATLGPAFKMPIQPGDLLNAAASCGIETLTVAIANVEGSNARTSANVQALLDIDADLLATVETGPRFLPAARNLQGGYVVVYKGGPTSSAYLWSRRAIRPIARPDRDVWPKAESAAALIDLGGRDVGVLGLHLARPVVDRQQAMIETLPKLVEAFPPTRILLGDLNATPWSEAMTRIERAVDAQAIPGWRITWRGNYPNPFFGLPLPALIGNQIDHILISPDIGVRSISTFALLGSAHRGVLAELQIPDANCDDLPTPNLERRP